MSRSDAFAQLASLVRLQEPLWIRRDLVPIEQTVDGWYCLTDAGSVVHLGEATFEAVGDPRVALALIGKLTTKYPLATAFIPRLEEIEVCGSCIGTGVLRDVPIELRSALRCECGGLGWRPAR